ncbi:acetyltransferase [Burkholderia ubonensis]|uniref:Acetyltransferase n=1 Tax=Burkholderia ubonensis TaxID=101571 RepID=A0AB73FU32_9BURK|nr:GNAT family N-acetyltransferase [Burkholderia ubonensis]KVL82862.1 acetyltransferase [Burkholderia ubonensis]KVM23859.1 acetyltransferase [Burkholderia ubonensis]KVM35362.1 acetyltransferase [Burkholderia ubonensis]KVM61558.1 acetyltransferase [Burkholderia ubonensis]
MIEGDLGNFYDVRFSVRENRIHPHQVHLLDRSLLVAQIDQGGGWICTDSSTGAAAGVCLPILGDVPMIGALFVRPTYHGRGIGGELLNRSLDWLKSKGVDEVTLVTDPGSNADHFYQRRGWIRGDFDAYGVQVVFKKRLEGR